MGVGDGLMARYGSAQGAAAYRGKYDKSWSRRLSGRRELGLVARALAHAGAEGVVLDAPCGAGRLVPTILARASRVTAIDLSTAMIDEARAALAPEVDAGRVVLGTGSAEALSFPDGAFDTAVCWRLLHHLVDRAARVRVLRELRRVSRRAVVVSFADAGTWKARFQRWRHRDRRCVKLSRADLVSEARDAGLSVDATWRLASLFSLQAAAVLTRRFRDRE